MSFRRSRKLPCPQGTATGKLFLGRDTWTRLGTKRSGQSQGLEEHLRLSRAAEVVHGLAGRGRSRHQRYPFRSHPEVDLPDDLEEPPRNFPFRSTGRHLRSLAERVASLLLQRPPIDPRQRVVDEDDGVGTLDPLRYVLAIGHTLHD